LRDSYTLRLEAALSSLRKATSFLHGPPPQARGTGAKADSATGERNGSGCAAARQDRASHSSDTGADGRVLILCRHAGTSGQPEQGC
jgi:hypothetical protein